MDESNNYFTLVYPGGAGGHWLCNTIYCLENNQLNTNTPRHYGNQPWAKILPRHNIPANASAYKIFSSEHSFNFYINTVHKLMHHTTQHQSFCEVFNIASQRASWQFDTEYQETFMKNIDLRYDLIFKDPDLFTTQLFAILDEYNIAYIPSYGIVDDCMSKYRRSCANPMEYFDNFDNIFWLGWCSGILHHEQLPAGINYDSCTIETVQKALLPRRAYFAEYTRSFIL